MHRQRTLFNSAYIQAGLVVCAVIIAFVSIWLPTYQSYVKVSPPDELLDFFEASVLHDDGERRNHLSKWHDGFRIRVFGTPTGTDRRELDDALVLLSRLTGHSFMFTEDEKPDIKIAFVEHKDVPTVIGKVSPDFLSEYKQSGEPVRLIHCYTLTKVRKANYPKAFQLGPALIVIATDLERKNYLDAIFRWLFLDGPDIFHGSCVAEELMNTFGFSEDTERLSPSAINDRPSAEIFSANDKLLIRALYDPRLKAGMARDEALIIAKQVIEELVAAYNEHGEEALYQR